MADEDLSLDDPKDDAEGEAGGGKSKLIIIIAIAAVLVIGGGAAAFFLLSGSDDEGQAVTETEDGASGNAGSVVEPPKGDAIYVTIPDPFRVNIQGGKKGRLMEVRVVLMVRSKEAEDAVKRHIPLMRNNLLDFYSLANAETVLTEEGREALKAGSLERVRQVMQEQVGYDAVEKVLFTGFAVQ